MPVTRLVPPHDWPTLGWQVIDWTEHYLCHGPGDIQGQALVWDDEFAQIICDAYRLFPRGHELAGRRVSSYFKVSMPKGRAKSEFAGALTLAEARGPVRFDGWDVAGEPVGRPVTYPFIRCLATEEGQTTNTYGNVLVMGEHARDKFSREWGFDQLDLGSTRTLIGRGGRDGEIRPSSAGAASKDGGKESFSVADEPHLYVLAELRQMHAMVRRNTRKRRMAEPWMLATGTMFEPGQGSVAEDLYDEAEKQIQLASAGKRKTFGFCFHHREGDIDPDTEWDDDTAQVRSLTEAYGPAAEWMDLRGIVSEEIRAPGSVKAENLRYFHNRRWKGENKAVDPAKWAELADPKRTPTGGEAILLAFDGSDRGEHADDTVLIGWTISERPHLFLVHREHRPTRAGREYVVDRRAVRQVVTATRETFDVRRFACDPPGWREEIDAWADEFGRDSNGDPIVVEFITSRPSEMGPAIDRFLEAIDRKSFTHDGSPELTDYALNALLTKSKGRADYPALAKPSVDKKIDGLVAATLGFDVLADLPVDTAATPAVAGDVDPDALAAELARIEEDEARAIADLLAP